MDKILPTKEEIDALLQRDDVIEETADKILEVEIIEIVFDRR